MSVFRAFVTRSMHASVRRSAIADIEDVDRFRSVVDLVDDPVTFPSQFYTVERYRRSFELLAAARAWVVLERLEGLKNPKNLLLRALQAVDFL